MEVYCIESDEWTTAPPLSDGGREFHYSCAAGDFVYVAGGDCIVSQYSGSILRINMKKLQNTTWEEIYLAPQAVHLPGLEIFLMTQLHYNSFLILGQERARDRKIKAYVIREFPIKKKNTLLVKDASGDFEGLV